MNDQTNGISWTDKTVNPIRARWKDGRPQRVSGHYCEKISPGCTNCYASALQPRFQMPTFDKQSLDDIEPYLDEKVLQKMLRLRQPCKVFVCDMTDMFGEWVLDEWLDKIFAVAALTPHITWQILTKRPERMQNYMQAAAEDGFPPWAKYARATALRNRLSVPDTWLVPLPNVWLGVSVENKATLWRIDELRKTPAAIRFVSFEPLLEDLGSVNLDGIYWAILGGESRPCDLAWIRSLRDQCRESGVALFVKQLGRRPYTKRVFFGQFSWNYTPMQLKDSHGGDISEWPPDLKIREFPT